MGINHSQGLSACSVKTFSGFNHTEAEEVPLSIGSMVQSYVAGKAAGGWKGGGCEILVGIECNSNNPAQASHHKYTHHSGHIVQRVVNGLGLGEVHLSKWSSGDGDTGSQMRTVTWDLLPRKIMEERITVLRHLAEAGELSPDGIKFLAGYDTNAKW